MHVRDGKRMVEIWLSNAEKNDPALREGLKDVYDTYKKKRYLVAVYESGGGDLYQSTLELLRYNRRRMAELAVRREERQRAAAER